MEYDLLPVTEQTCLLYWDTSETVSGQKVKTPNSRAVRCKLFIDEAIPQFMLQNINETSASLDKYLILIPGTESIPVSTKVKYKATINGVDYKSTRIHKLFSHYTIECEMVV
jgi:hypothetical protein